MSRTAKYSHHARAIEKAKERLLDDPAVLAVFVGGSVAKNIEREDSDIDLIVVITDLRYAQRRAARDVAFLWRDVTDYEGGYVEGRYVSRSFVLAAAERGSEPTRHSFTGVFPIFCKDDELAEVVPAIPTYPEAERAGRIASFLAQFQLNRWYFWHEARRRDDPYLLARAATDIVLFGTRMLLAHNRQLFQNQKRLLESLEAAPLKPDGIVTAARKMLTSLTDQDKEAFCLAIEQFTDWGKVDLLSQFLLDVELSWFDEGAPVGER